MGDSKSFYFLRKVFQCNIQIKNALPVSHFISKLIKTQADAQSKCQLKVTVVNGVLCECGMCCVVWEHMCVYMLCCPCSFEKPHQKKRKKKKRHWGQKMVYNDIKCPNSYLKCHQVCFLHQGVLFAAWSWFSGAFFINYTEYIICSFE